MKFLRTPAPYPSTIISLSPQEEFNYRTSRIQSITIAPGQAPYTLSGTSRLHPSRPHAYGLQDLPPQAPALVQTQAQAELQRYARPVPGLSADRQAAILAAPHSPSGKQFPHTAHTTLAAPGPAPTPAQQDSIRNSAQRTAPRLTPQPQHLAAPAPASRTPGAHRA